MSENNFDGPADPFDNSFSNAVMMHQTLESFVNAGFTRNEAFALVRDMMMLTLTAALAGESDS